MARDSIVNYTADDLFSSTGIGSLDKAIGLNEYGFNFSQAPTQVPRNKEQPGFVFFTRPQLNMQRDNILNVREFYNLMTSNSLSKEMRIRCLLDPRLGAGYQYLNTQAPIVQTPLVDNENCFIPMLTNNLMTLTGWPEEVMTFQRSKEDVYRGTHTQAQGVHKINSSFTLNATFRNTMNNPIIQMFHYWMMYMSCVTTLGTLRPYPDYEAMDIKDYNTRIYHLTLDAQMERVTGIYACGASIPSGNSISQYADYNRIAPIVDVNKDFTISFECDGAIILDPILFYTFNKVVSAFCPNMRDENRFWSMQKLGKFDRNYFRNIAYPYIDPQTSKFELYVRKELYEKRMQDITGIMNSEDYDEFEVNNDGTTPNPELMMA